MFNGLVSSTWNASGSIAVKKSDIIGISMVDDTHRRVFIVRDDGINYIFIGSIVVEVSSPYNNHGIGAIAGDGAYIHGEITSNTLKSAWTTDSIKPIIGGFTSVPTPPYSVQVFYFTKNNLSDFDCKAPLNSNDIRCEAVVTFSASEIGKRYWVNWIIRQPNGQDMAPYSEYMYVTATTTFYQDKAMPGLVAGTYTILRVEVSQG
ncbi:MAG: hypothetical protein Q8M94_08730 [Ignavibacteria bacterium]|nr:hypothetical protein [Ignavibacteria bacterium]